MTWFTPAKLKRKIKVPEFKDYYPPVIIYYTNVWEILWEMFPRDATNIGYSNWLFYTYRCTARGKALCAGMNKLFEKAHKVSPQLFKIESLEYKPYDYPVTKIVEENSLKDLFLYRLSTQKGQAAVANKLSSSIRFGSGKYLTSY